MKRDIWHDDVMVITLWATCMAVGYGIGYVLGALA